MAYQLARQKRKKARFSRRAFGLLFLFTDVIVQAITQVFTAGTSYCFIGGRFDQILGVGDVVITGNHDGYNTRNNLFRGITICDIADYAQVYQLVKRLQTDIYADTMYPNDLRPKENHGYKTQYKSDDDSKE